MKEVCIDRKGKITVNDFSPLVALEGEIEWGNDLMEIAGYCANGKVDEMIRTLRFRIIARCSLEITEYKKWRNKTLNDLLEKP